MKYEWDPDKANSNLKKHRISFEQAVLVFEDRMALEDYDERHSTKSEKRFARLGLSEGTILYVIYTVREMDEEVLRIISARLATAKEEAIYWEQRYEK